MDRFERARSLIVDGRYKKALREYEKIKSKHPGDERTLCGIALVHLLKGRLAEAADCMDDILKVRPDAAYPYGIKGAIASEIDPRNAMRLYDAHISADPSETAAYVRKAQILLGKGLEKECADVIGECAKAADPDAGTSMAVERLDAILGSVKAGQQPDIRTGDSAVFVPGLSTLLDKVVGNDLCGSDQADSDSVRLGGMDEKTVAIAELGRGLGAHPDPHTLRAMGDLLYDIGCTSESLTYYERAIEQDPGDMLCYGHKLAVLEDVGDLPEIAKCLKKILKATPRDERGTVLQERVGLWRRTRRRSRRGNFIVDGIASAAKWHIARRKYDPSCMDSFTPCTAKEAGLDARRALAKMDDCIEAASARKLPKLQDSAKSHLEQDIDAALATAAKMLADGKPRKAMNEYRKAERHSPRDERVLCGIVLMYLWSGHSNKTREYAEKLYAVRPDAAYLHGALGMSWEEWRSYDRALKCYDQMLEADPGEVSAYVRKAMILRLNSMEKECAKTIQECLDASWSGRESPKEKRRLREMGQSIEKNGRVTFKVHDNATFFPGLWEMLDIVFGPDRATGAPDAELDFEGIRLAGKGDLQGCLEQAERAIKGQPHSTTPWRMKGMLLAEDGRVDEAIACYERAANIDSDDMTVCYDKAALLVDEGDIKGALKCIDGALDYELEDDRGFEMQKELAYVHEELKNFGEWPRPESLRAISGMIQWAAGRRVKSLGAKQRSSGRQASAEPRFPPGLVDDAQLKDGRPRAGHYR